MNATKTCTNPDCGKMLVRKPGEWLSRWEARTFCDATCFAASRRQPVEVKPCGWCGQSMTRNAGESPAHFVARGMCSLECRHAVRVARAAEARAKNVKPCGRVGCDKLARQGPRESVYRWEARKFCSLECAGVAKQKPGSESRRRAMKAAPVASGGATPPVPAPTPVARPMWRPSTPGWVLRPGDAGYQEEAS